MWLWVVVEVLKAVVGSVVVLKAVVGCGGGVKGSCGVRWWC